MAFKMKGFSGFGNSPMKKIKLKNIFKRNKNKKTEEDIAREEYEKRTKNLKNDLFLLLPYIRFLLSILKYNVI